MPFLCLGLPITSPSTDDTLTCDVYFDGDLIADGFNFRNTAHDALGWLMIGFDAGVGLLGYYDDIIIGDGDCADVTAGYMGKGARAWSAGPVIRIGAQSGDPGFIVIHDGSDDNIVQAAKFEVGEWHHIREVIDVDNQTFDVYLDGKKLGNYKFRNASHDTIDWLMIGFDEGIGTLGYYDAIEFGLGTGESAFVRATPVEPAGELSTAWGVVKSRY